MTFALWAMFGKTVCPTHNLQPSAIAESRWSSRTSTNPHPSFAQLHRHWYLAHVLDQTPPPQLLASATCAQSSHRTVQLMPHLSFTCTSLPSTDFLLSARTSFFIRNNWPTHLASAVPSGLLTHSPHLTHRSQGTQNLSCLVATNPVHHPLTQLFHRLLRGLLSAPVRNPLFPPCPSPELTSHPTAGPAPPRFLPYSDHCSFQVSYSPSPFSFFHSGFNTSTTAQTH